ncbi:MAG: hypothetical protein MO847_06425 [Candidatus Protistobacter heckmanni]|nr:hypothetical protein [Candidatus Protistobacter heckmanni]
MLLKGQNQAALLEIDRGAKDLAPQDYAVLRSVALISLKRWKEADDIAEAALAKDPGNLSLANNLAVSLWGQGKANNARQVLEDALSAAPAFRNLRKIYARQAAESYGKALGFKPKAAEVQLAASTRMGLDLPGQTQIAQASTPAPAPAAPAILAEAAPAPSLEAPPQVPVPAAPKPATVAQTPPAQPAAPAFQPPAAPVVQQPAASSPVVVAAAPEPAAKPAAKPSEPVKVSDAKPTAADVAQVERSVKAWVAAWSSKDVDGYLAHYASTFDPEGGMDLPTWREQRRQRVGKPGNISVELENLRVSTQGGTIRADFRQKYQSANLKTSTTKTLEWVKENGRWLISREIAK